MTHFDVDTAIAVVMGLVFWLVLGIGVVTIARWLLSIALAMAGK